MKGTNSTVMKANNRRLILNLIRHGQYSRTDIASYSGLTKATITGLTEELLNEGLISESEQGTLSGAGRRPTYLALEENSRYVIAFTMTRSGYTAEVYNIVGKSLDYIECEYDATPQESILTMSDIVTRFCRKYSKEKILGIGISCPGPVDYKSGTFLNPPNFSAWHNVNIKGMLESRTDLPVFVENIANALAIYERDFGCCVSESNFAYVLVDDGIGAGIIVNGEIYRGAMGHGNEIGHTVVEIDGKVCPCGNRGCLERYASIPEILKGTRYSSWQDVIAANDKSLIYAESRYLSAALTNLVNLFDLNAIVIGGGIAKNGEALAENISKTFETSLIVKHPVWVGLSTTDEIMGGAAASVVLNNLLF